MEKNPHKIHRLRSSSIDGFSRPPSIIKKPPTQKLLLRVLGHLKKQDPFLGSQILELNLLLFIQQHI